VGPLAYFPAGRQQKAARPESKLTFSLNCTLNIVRGKKPVRFRLPAKANGRNGIEINGQVMGERQEEKTFGPCQEGKILFRN